MLASLCMLLFLHRHGHSLVGVWLALVVLYTCRLVAVFWHHAVLGPLAPRNLLKRGQNLAF